MNRTLLNIPYNLSDENWQQIDAIYRAMPGWKGYVHGSPQWHLPSGYSVVAMVEPKGLCFETLSSERDLSVWLCEFMFRASEALGFSVQNTHT
ncbi:hypothetical protein VST7929_01801 [Vibrio stylophorae]|uniref:Uncharacterized protein n=1 Tax=Vibrio stylophorae TaxID=659351 RepID=A0ABM8ZUC3_9VIBR|nr:hypothetical protein [Vibrio stylophorae]CAH0533924.1 hypothetical protein VST7929_01801 [Vibrio stylophorae]